MGSVSAEELADGPGIAGPCQRHQGLLSPPSCASQQRHLSTGHPTPPGQEERGHSVSKTEGPPGERISSLVLGVGDALDQGPAHCGPRDDSPPVSVNKALLERSLALLPGSDGSLQQTGVLLTRPGLGSVHHVTQTHLPPKLEACPGSGPLPGGRSDLPARSACDDASCSPAQPPTRRPVPSLTAASCRALLSRPSFPQAPPSGL